MPDIETSPVQETSLPHGITPPKPLAPEDDPNLKMQSIIRKRTEKAEEKKDDKPTEPEKKEDGGKLSGVIGKALGFRDTKPDEKKDDKKEPDKEPEAKKEPDDKKEDPAKTVVKRKREAAPAPVIDPVQIAEATATAVARAIGTDKKQPPAGPAPEDSLKEGDRHEYEVAKYLAANDPKFKDAPRTILSNIARAESYATRWEAANPGKEFNPDDEEHNTFYASIKAPWSDYEFQQAISKMANAAEDQKKSEQSNKEKKELESKIAKLELNPVVDRTHVAAAALLAKSVGDDIHKAIVEQGFEKFSDADPLTADALAAEAGEMKPLIEAAIQLDDPQGRFPFDPSNKLHREWSDMILDLEAALAGQEDTAGRTFVSRAKYAAMGPRQRTQHWYLTTEQVIESMVSTAADRIKKQLEKEKERHKKIAASLGYIPKGEKTEGDDKTKPSKEDKEKEKKKEEPTTRKPESPSAGGGAPIDDKGAGAPTSTGKLLSATAGILFNR